MKDVEVLGMELRQFRESDQANALRAIAPSVIGRTSEAEVTKRQVHGPSAPLKLWTASSTSISG